MGALGLRMKSARAAEIRKNGDRGSFPAGRQKMRGSFAPLQDHGEEQATANDFPAEVAKVAQRVQRAQRGAVMGWVIRYAGCDDKAEGLPCGRPSVKQFGEGNAWLRM